MNRTARWVHGGQVGHFGIWYLVPGSKLETQRATYSHFQRGKLRLLFFWIWTCFIILILFLQLLQSYAHSTGKCHETLTIATKEQPRERETIKKATER